MGFTMADLVERNVKESLSYDKFVLLPALKDVHERIKAGHFDRVSWNMIIDLYNRLPRVVQEKIDFKSLMSAENNKQMCIILFVQIRHYLEESGFLRDTQIVEGGTLDF